MKDKSNDKKTSMNSNSMLAMNGGQPVINRPAPALVRWGDPERKQLSEMINQPALFYWKGPQTTLLIERFQKHYPLKYVMPCSSGTAAIHIAIAAAGIGPGDEVITSPITDMGTVIGILYQQGVPVFADLEPHRYNLDVEDVRRKITPRTKAILAVHLAGNPCDLTALKKLADEHKLVLIEDCAQAWGAMHRGKPIGTIGHIGCYSLNDFKHIGCGDGGVVASSDERFGPLLQKFGDKAYDRVTGTRMPEFLAPNYRMSEPQSAVAAVQMTRMEDIAEKRFRLGRLLTREIEGIRGIHPHHAEQKDRCSYWFYMFRLDLRVMSCSRNGWVQAARAEGASFGEGYIAAPLYKYPIFQNQNFFAGRWPIKELGLTKMDYRQVSCPQTEAILENCVTTPINQAMDEDWIKGVAGVIRKVSNHFGKEK
ncbi:MAG: DegT/DnrJ/EryC1/StrS family aminotransferase [Verrucomicrobiae bacterium]|nr:DegT/DnrJ/EryC1/StrS family aminotransferase [Verrucomicrobiae bacterium]